MYDKKRLKDAQVRASLLGDGGCATISPMNRLARGLALLLLASCGESPAPPPSPSPSAPAKAVPPSPPPEAKPPETAKKKELVDKKGRSKSPELYRKYMTLMDSNGELLQSIEEDVEKTKGDAVIKPKIQKIVKNIEAARALHYRKDPDEDALLDADFDLFLSKRKDLEEPAWDADRGKGLFEKLGSRCELCHTKFQ